MHVFYIYLMLCRGWVLSRPNKEAPRGRSGISGGDSPGVIRRAHSLRSDPPRHMETHFEPTFFVLYIYIIYRKKIFGEVQTRDPLDRERGGKLPRHIRGGGGVHAPQTPLPAPRRLLGAQQTPICCALRTRHPWNVFGCPAGSPRPLWGVRPGPSWGDGVARYWQNKKKWTVFFGTLKIPVRCVARAHGADTPGRGCLGGALPGVGVWSAGHGLGRQKGQKSVFLQRVQPEFGKTVSFLGLFFFRE